MGLALTLANFVDVKAVSFDFVIEGHAGNAQQTGSFTAVAAGFIEHVVNMVFLDFTHGLDARAEGAAPAAEKAAPPRGWKLVWRDEFNGRKLDPKKWNVLLREHSKHNELQYYVPDEAYVENGCLRLRSRVRDYGAMHYTSGRVDTSGKLAPVYGRFEIRGRLPGGKGLWPAYWLYPQNRDWRMEQLMAQTGRHGFHFTDEAAPPALLRDLALEILRRRITVAWWTNIRLYPRPVHPAEKVGVHRGFRGAGGRFRPDPQTDKQGRHRYTGCAGGRQFHPCRDHGARLPDVRLSHPDCAGNR